MKDNYPKGGMMVVVSYRNKFLMIHRDNNPKIRNPDTWAPVTGGFEEEDKDILDGPKRELKEEVNLVTDNIRLLGITTNEVGFFFVRLNRKEKLDTKYLNEGQDKKFISFEQMEKYKIGGTFSTYFQKYKEIFKKIALEDYEPTGEDFGLNPWKNEETKAELKGNLGLH